MKEISSTPRLQRPGGPSKRSQPMRVVLVGSLIAFGTVAAESAVAQSENRAKQPSTSSTGKATPPTAAPRAPDVRIGDNVFVIPDAQARSITGWLVVKAGCADEPGGRCVGLAHYLEHLLFINRDNEHRSKVALFPDGAGNGWTTHRATVYFQRFPSRPESDVESTGKLVAYLAGLLRDVRADEAQAERERNVVLQEYQQNTGRNPFARFQIDLGANLMPDEPLGQRVIGSPATIARFTLADARAFHTKWYAPNNAYLVLHGPVSPAVVEAAVARHLTQQPRKPLEAHAWQTTRAYLPQTRMLRSTGNDVKQTAVYLDRIVTIKEAPEDRAMNDTASAVAQSFLASRLAGSPYELLVERDEMATDVRLGIGRVRDGQFKLSFFAVPAAGVSPESVIEAGRAYIARTMQRGLTDAVVARLKMRITNERALLAEQPSAYAQSLMNWLSSHGTYEEWTSRQARHDALTSARVDDLMRSLGAGGREVAGILAPALTAKIAPAQPAGPTPALDISPALQLPGAR